MRFGLPFYLALPAAMALAGVIAYLISIPSLRLKGDFFVLATLGFQMIIYAILNNWDAVTKGPYGISGIPTPSLFGLALSSPPKFLILSGGIACAVAMLVWRISTMPFGRTLRAIRDDELAALSLGKDIRSFQRKSFVVAGILAAPAGALLAAYNSYVDPTSFTLEESMLILCAVIIGGAGNFRGPITGALILILLPEALRFLKIPDSMAGSLRQILFGLIVILIMRWRPKGISGEYAFH
jgi:branched-chain amino acid transport system permease protein